jgi:RNA-directed DNA polymerase
MPEGHREATVQGVPQGGPLSPLLANVMLDPPDQELEKRGLRFTRYADDSLILAQIGISHTYRQVLELDPWIRRRVRLCYWKQWKRPGTRRRHLLSLGIGPEEVHWASRCRRGYWWMSGNGIVQRALDNTWLAEQGVPNLRQQWIELRYGKQNPHWDPASVNLTGTAWCGPVC